MIIVPLNLLVTKVQTCEDLWPNCGTYTEYCPGERRAQDSNAPTVQENCAGTCRICENYEGMSQHLVACCSPHSPKHNSRRKSKNNFFSIAYDIMIPNRVFHVKMKFMFYAWIYIKGFQNVWAKNKVASSGTWTHSTDHYWIRRQMLIQLYQPDMCYLRDLKLKFVSCTISHFGLGSFIESIKHDFM